ncbi:MAG: hypothetical protein M3Y32_14930 [Pseudomonadota bacterium]|nr:hypothetical protein [Pseudomonadota bacterium]
MAVSPDHKPLRVDKFNPITPRRRLLIVVLALSTAGLLMYSVLERPGLHLTRPIPLEPARCAKGQQIGCVGGQVDVIVVAPTAEPASQPPR